MHSNSYAIPATIVEWYRNFALVVATMAPSHKWTRIMWSLAQIWGPTTNLFEDPKDPVDCWLREEGNKEMLNHAKAFIAYIAKLSGLEVKEVVRRLQRALERHEKHPDPMRRLFADNYYAEWKTWAEHNFWPKLID